MNEKEYNKLCQENGGKEEFDKKYVFKVWVNDPEFKTHAAAQARASGHRFDKVPTMQADVRNDGQVVPGSVRMKGRTPELMDGYTRFYALKREEEETGVKQYMLVSSYHHQQGMTSIDWLIFQWRMNEGHLTCSPNTREDYEKFIANLFSEGYWNKKFGFTQEANPIEYRDRMLEDISENFRSRFRSDVVRRIVERVLGNLDYCPDFWTYDKTSAVKAVANAKNIEWSGARTGFSDRGTRAYVCAMDATIRKDQLSYAFNSRHNEVVNRTDPDRVVLCFYEKSMESKDRHYLEKQRKDVLDLVKKYNDSDVLASNLLKRIEDVLGKDSEAFRHLEEKLNLSPSSRAPLWDEVCFLPQDKSQENEDEVIWVTI